ncbi:uncharacterized protein PV09_08651 [Verruconis gallopava]|uniref:Uncharacterized protein n=1 Tax=Verruconis gallopava TaxID=253628 RepID=A0A0D1YG28_9PEZI|nr:uncharacterized protein PV09_08651 [Verruconis gallopava]KIV99721.1 hypothetical protein PV09_08651 [Verruconis gallopava]
MESNDPRRRQSHPSGYSSQQGLLQASSQYPATSVPDRFRSTQLGIQSPTSAPTTARSGNLQSYSYGYGESSSFAGSSMTPGSISYQSEYSQDTQRQSQSYGQYSSNMIYNVPSQQSAPSQSPYESVQQYQQPRQTAALDVLPNQFGVAQPYYAAGEGGPTSAPVAAMGTQNPSTQYSQMSYGSQPSVTRESMQSTYGMTGAHQGSQSGYGQSGFSVSELEAAYSQYQTELKKTFEAIRDGRLTEAGNSLVSISEWLLGNAEALGLVRDDEQLHADRLKLWEQFNTAWLSALQTQRDMTVDMIDTGQRPQSPRTMMDSHQMESMGKELVELCDLMEKHGLVDYQMGVWEEDIISLLNSCLDLLEDYDASRSNSNQLRR